MVPVKKSEIDITQNRIPQESTETESQEQRAHNYNYSKKLASKRGVENTSNMLSHHVLPYRHYTDLCYILHYNHLILPLA